MQFLCIGVNECADDVKKHITHELTHLNNMIKYSIDEVNAGDSTSIICSINNEDKVVDKKTVQLYDAFRVHVSNALADCIIGKYEEKLICRIINSNYCYFNSLEKKQIIAFALKIIKNEEKSLLNSLFQIRRRNVIVRKLLDYFEGSNSLILDGFVNFRLKEYTKDLEEIVDKAVDDFLMEREYNEFIRLLRYFVEIQEPKFEEIHIVGVENRYLLLDDLKKEITNASIEDLANEVSEGEINNDDLLVSSLITLAPTRIIIHSSAQFRNKELLDTIKNVFSGKVILCDGCDICFIRKAKK